LLAFDVPNARDSVTVLALTEGGTTTAVVEVGKGINALVVTTDQAGKRARRETFSARGNVTRAILALLSDKAFVPRLVLVVTIVVVAIVVVAIVVVAVVVIPVVVVVIPGFIRRSRWVGQVGIGWGRVTAEAAIRPLPVGTALRGSGIIGLEVRGTTPQSVVPRPVIGTVFAGRWIVRTSWSPVGKTAVFGLPPELITSTVSVVFVVGEDEGQSEGQKEDANNERHFEK